MIGRLRSQTMEASKLIVDWMEHRTGIVTMLEHFLYEPVPKRGAWLYTLGSAVLFTITLQFLTGILLLFYYVPTTDHAWNSVYYIMNDAYFGQLIRGIHYWSANFLLALIGLHMAQVFFSGGYMINFLMGGDVVGPSTLSRFFAIHVWLLPATIAPFIGIHLYLLRRHGVFGSEFEYTDRLAKLHERERVEEYAGYEIHEDEGEPYVGRRDRADRGADRDGE